MTSASEGVVSGAVLEAEQSSPSRTEVTIVLHRAELRCTWKRKDLWLSSSVAQLADLFFNIMAPKTRVAMRDLHHKTASSNNFVKSRSKSFSVTNQKSLCRLSLENGEHS